MTIVNAVLNLSKLSDVYPYSLQLHLSEVKEKYHVWDIFQGPSGVAVNPCGDSRFEKVYHGEPGWHTNLPDMDHPPFPQNYSPFVSEVHLSAHSILQFMVANWL